MEKSKPGNQATQEDNCNHVEKDRLLRMTMILSVSKGPPQASLEKYSPSRPCPRIGRARPNRLPSTTKPRTCIYNRQQWRGSSGSPVWMLMLLASIWIVPVSGVFIDFQNCLSDAYQKNTPLQLQFVPKFVNAVFNTTDPNHNLNVTVWGNVTGSGPEHLVILPPANDTDYWNSNQTNLGGKILDLPDPDDTDPKLTTLFSKVNVLTYEPWSESVKFCNQLVNSSCPLGPVFSANG